MHQCFHHLGPVPNSDENEKSKSGKEKNSLDKSIATNINTLAMLEELSRLLCAYLLSTQDQERSRTMLQALVQKGG